MLFQKEVKKLLITYKGLVILAVCLALRLLLLGFFPEMKDGRIRLSQKQYDRYLSQLSGENTPEKSEFIRKEYETMGQVLSKKGEMEQAHMTGDLSDVAWSEYLKELDEAEHRISSLKIFAEKEAQFAAQPETLPPAHYIYEYRWQTVYTLLSVPDIFLLFGLLLLTAQSFTPEAAGGMLPVLLAARDGRKRLFETKLLALLSVSLAVTMLSSGLEALIFWHRGFFADGNVPIYSVTAMTSCQLNLSLIQGYVLCLGLRLVGVLLFVAGAYGLSLWVRSTTNLIFLGLCILGLPLLWGGTLALFTHGGLLAGAKTLLWAGASGLPLAVPLLTVALYSGAVVYLAARRHQRGL